jgi:hypothetical protein
MLYKGQLNELIRLAEIDASNPICLKKNYWRFMWFSLDELKLMLTEEFLFPANSILFLTEYHKVEVLKVTPLDSF